MKTSIFYDLFYATRDDILKLFLSHCMNMYVPLVWIVLCFYF